MGAWMDRWIGRMRYNRWVHGWIDRLVEGDIINGCMDG